MFRASRVSPQQTDVNIVVATGAYVIEQLPLYFHFRGPGAPAGGPEMMTPLFIQDITEGISGTGVNAAILKCVTDAAGLTRDVERVLRSVAQAHRETGAPITTHTHVGTKRGLDQQRVFAEEGVDLSRVIIGHSGDTDDYAYLEELIANGSYLGMDRFGLETVSFEKRVEIVAEMCHRGHADRMVLSHDTSCFSDLSDPVRREELYPKWRWTHIPQDVVPALKARGVGPVGRQRRWTVGPPPRPAARAAAPGWRPETCQVDGGDGVARHPLDPVDVGPAVGDPPGHGRHRRRPSAACRSP